MKIKSGAGKRKKNGPAERSDAVSPQAADVIDEGRNKHGREIKRKIENNFIPDKQVENGDEGLVKQRREDIDVETLHGKYKNFIQSNLSDAESDLERDEINSYSPDEGFNASSRKFDFAQRLPSNINPYTSAFGAEEARLRFNLESVQFKERLGIAPFPEQSLHRRYSLQDSVQNSDKLASQNSSPPSSPHSQSLQSSPLPSYVGHGPRSVHDVSFEEQDSNNFLPRIKEGLFFCHLCSFSGTTQAEFDQHMTVHFEHICPHCDYKSRTEGRLKRHIKDFHTEDPDGGYNRTMPGRPKVFRCKQCDYSTTEKIDFWTHSRSHIKEDKLLQCPRCPFVTEYKHHLEYHLRNHFGSKPFKCPKCNYACVNKSMLNSHMKSHTNVYQYRCADCTYATKYCHSLKLHLRKYNHKPAAVLNSDGSLPQGVDATASGLSLMAKRGPPRGPRGPRKDKLDQSPGSFMPMPPTSMAPIPGLPGMISPFWPLMQGQIPGHLPHPLGLGPRFNPHFARFPNFGIKTEELKSPPPSSSSDPFKCNFCSFVGTSREVLTSHVMKVHASENKDLFSMFGLSSESLLEDGQKRMNVLNSFRSPLKSPRMDGFSSGMDLSPEVKKEAEEMHKINREKEEAMKMSQFPFMSNKFERAGGLKDEGIDILKQMTLKFGSGPLDLKRKLPVEPVPISANSASDSPLDLTKRRSSPQVSQHENFYKREDAEGDHSSGENSVYSNEVTSPPPRKRSRKGKAFKLDTLCMKLQEKQGNMYGSDEDSAAEMDEMYTSDLLPVEADGQSPEEYSGNDNSYGEIESDNEQEEENPNELYDDKQIHKEKQKQDSDNSDIDNDVAETENRSRTVDDDDKSDDTAEKLPEDDLKKIHASLNVLTEKVCVKEDSDDHNEEPSEMEQTSNGMSEDVDILKIDEEVKKSPSLPGFYSQNRRKPVPAAIQRGADIAWKILNDPKMSDPTQLIRNGENGHKLELSALDKKLWLDAPYCTKSQKGDYECPHCQISFGDCIMYTMHMGYHGYKDPYKCNMCGDTCKDRVEFFLHIARAAHN